MKLNTDDEFLVPDDPSIDDLPDPPGPGAWEWDPQQQQWIPLNHEPA
jgi:hypothetical protein